MPVVVSKRPLGATAIIIRLTTGSEIEIDDESMGKNRSIHVKWFAENPDCDNWDGARFGRRGENPGPIARDVLSCLYFIISALDHWRTNLQNNKVKRSTCSK